MNKTLSYFRLVECYTQSISRIRVGDRVVSPRSVYLIRDEGESGSLSPRRRGGNASDPHFPRLRRDGDRLERRRVYFFFLISLIASFCSSAYCTQGTFEEEYQAFKSALVGYNLHPATQDQFKNEFQSPDPLREAIIHVGATYKKKIDKFNMNNLNKNALITKINWMPLKDCLHDHSQDAGQVTKETCLISIKGCPFETVIKYLIDHILLNNKSSSTSSNVSNGKYEIGLATEGFAGAQVYVLKNTESKKNVLAIKIFENKENEEDDKVLAGVAELAGSVLALASNPSPDKLKMARIFAATHHEDTRSPSTPPSHLIFVMEGATGSDLYSCLQFKSADGTEKTQQALKASAQYLALLHLEMHRLIFKRDEIKDGSSLDLERASDNDDPVTNCRRYIAFERAFNDGHAVAYKNLIDPSSKVYESLEEVFKSLSKKKITRSNLEFDDLIHYLESVYEKAITRNSPDNIKNKIRLTMTHGDMHGGNLFYDADLHDVDLTSRLTLIDFSTMAKTYSGLGDPAEDVGRFVGSLWSRAAYKGLDSVDGNLNQEISSLKHLFHTIFMWQEIFIEKYLSITGQLFSESESEQLFRENVEFYKLRYYKVKFGNVRLPDSVKERLLYFWLLEPKMLSDCGLI